MSSIVISGDVSGAATIVAPSAAGTPTLTLPTTSGTLAVSGGTPSFGTLTVTGSANLATSSGSVGIGSSTSSKLGVYGSFTKNTSDENTWGVRVSDTQSMAAGVGGGLVFTGNYTSGGAAAGFASISGVKENSTTSNGLGNLVLYTTNVSSVLTERMRITGAGEVGIGTSTPGDYGQFVLYKATGDVETATVTGSANYATYRLQNSSRRYSMQIRTDQSNAWVLRDETAGENRMLIDTSGNVIVNGSSTISGYRFTLYHTDTNGMAYKYNGTSEANSCSFQNGNGQVGRIYTSGSNTTYSTSSDYRLKENIAPMTGALDKITQLKPVTYTWKVDGSAGQGFIAHELQSVVPDCVGGEKDAVDEQGNPIYQDIDTSFLVATLTAALQEQQALIVQLQADVAALKGTK